MRFYIFLYCLLLFCNSFAQAPAILQWQKNYGGSSVDTAMDFTILPDGSMVILGSSLSNDGDISGHHGPVNFKDISVIKTDPAGNIIWQKNYGGTFGQQASTILSTADGGFIFVGNTNSNDGDVSGNHKSGTADIWVVKIDGAGNIVWQKCYGGTLDDFGSKIIETSGGFIITGSVFSKDGDVAGHHGNNYTDIWIFKIDPSGNLLWQRCYGGTMGDAGLESTITPATDGSFILTCFTDSDDGDVSNFPASAFQATWIVKITATGSIIWDKCIDVATQGGYVNKVIAKTDGSFFITGHTYSSYFSGVFRDSEAWLLQMDAAGNITWVKTSGGTGFDRINDAYLTPDGGYLLMGCTQSADDIVCQKHLNNEVWLVKTDASGNVQWNRTFGGSKSDYGKKMAFTPAGDCYVFSSANSSDGDLNNNKGSADFWLSKFSFTGTLLYPSIVISAETDSIVCSGKQIHFIAATVDGGTQPIFQWKLNGVNIGANSDTLRITNLLSSDIITCTLTSNSSCVDIKTANSNSLSVKVGPLQPPKLFLPKDTALCSFQKIELNTRGKFSSYLWSNNSTTESITVKQPGLYWLEVTDQFKCTGRDSVIIFPKTCIEGIFIPNVFTPNNDGKNDVFRPIMNAYVKEYRFIIYNRWGQIIFETAALNKGWDGTVKGLPYDTGVFIWQCIYQLEGEAPASKRGTVLLMR